MPAKDIRLLLVRLTEAMVPGTDAPLAEVLQSVAAGHPFVKIAEVFQLTLRQLVAVLQFAAEGAAPAPSAK